MQNLGEIIFGIPWNDSFQQALYEGEQAGDYGFKELYHGSADRFVGYLGVKLGTLSCGQDYIEIKDLFKYQPTSENIKQVEALINQLPEHLKLHVEQVTTFIVWYTD